MKHLIALLALLLLVLPAEAQQFPGRYQATPTTLIDNQGTSPLTDNTSRLVVRPPVLCESSAVIDVSAGATDELVALTAGQTIYVCSFSISGDTAATTAQFKYGTGTTCGTGTVNLTGVMRLADEGNISLSAGAGGTLFRTIAANALCLAATTGAVTGFVSYSKF